MSANDLRTLDTLAAPRRSRAITTASLFYVIAGLGTTASEIPAIVYMIQERRFPVVFGIPLMGNSYAERLGIDFTIRTALLFVVVSVLDALAGYRLWKSDRRGGVLGLILLPFALAFWILFEIPAGFVLGPVRVIALALGWKSLR
jgi:hypothetical protein